MTVTEFVMMTVISFFNYVRADDKAIEQRPRRVLCSELQLTDVTQEAICTYTDDIGAKVTVHVRIERPWRKGARKATPGPAQLKGPAAQITKQ